jgi:hypothetical protein
MDITGFECMGRPKKCATGKLSIFSDYAASIMDITGFQCMG